jgi:hypothetical protein
MVTRILSIFLQLEKRNQESNCIKELVDDIRNIITGHGGYFR